MDQAQTQRISDPSLRKVGAELYLRREDQLFPMLSGNKFRKLKYNLKAASEWGYDTLMTFGGAFSNHIHATAWAGRQHGFRTVGLIRGDELEGKPLNPTLADARRFGMKLVFLSRKDYRRRNDPEFLQQLQLRYGPAYPLPEGGTNPLAIQGCAEILEPGDRRFDLICCPVGTGGTLAGLVKGSPGPKVWGYTALKAPGMERTLGDRIPGKKWRLRSEYHFGGYARIDPTLIEFLRAFSRDHEILLDPVYTGKMLYGILADVRKGVIPPGSRILAIHTGGLQGIRGMNGKLMKKGLPLLPL